MTQEGRETAPRSSSCPSCRKVGQYQLLVWYLLIWYSELDKHLMFSSWIREFLQVFGAWCPRFCNLLRQARIFFCFDIYTGFVVKLSGRMRHISLVNFHCHQNIRVTVQYPAIPGPTGALIDTFWLHKGCNLNGRGLKKKKVWLVVLVSKATSEQTNMLQQSEISRGVAGPETQTQWILLH